MHESMHKDFETAQLNFCYLIGMRSLSRRIISNQKQCLPLGGTSLILKEVPRGRQLEIRIITWLCQASDFIADGRQQNSILRESKLLSKRV